MCTYIYYMFHITYIYIYSDLKKLFVQFNWMINKQIRNVTFINKLHTNKLVTEVILMYKLLKFKDALFSRVPRKMSGT